MCLIDPPLTRRLKQQRVDLGLVAKFAGKPDAGHEGNFTFVPDELGLRRAIEGHEQKQGDCW